MLVQPVIWFISINHVCDHILSKWNSGVEINSNVYLIFIRKGSDLESRLSSAETKLITLEKKALNTGTSLAGICGALDALGDTISSQADKYHCCANQVNNKMFCFKTAVANGVGITTTNPGVCLDTDAICTGDWYRTLSRQIISYVLIILPLYTWNRKQLSFYD